MAPSSIEVVKTAVVSQVPQPVVPSNNEYPENRPVESVPAPAVHSQSSVSEEDLVQIAKDIEKAFGSTKVTFEGAASGNAHRIKFSVVDEKTGEVVFKFPLETGRSAQQQLASKESKGILITSKA